MRFLPLWLRGRTIRSHGADYFVPWVSFGPGELRRMGRDIALALLAGAALGTAVGGALRLLL